MKDIAKNGHDSTREIDVGRHAEQTQLAASVEERAVEFLRGVVFGALRVDLGLGEAADHLAERLRGNRPLEFRRILRRHVQRTTRFDSTFSTPAPRAPKTILKAPRCLVTARRGREVLLGRVRERRRRVGRHRRGLGGEAAARRRRRAEGRCAGSVRESSEHGCGLCPVCGYGASSALEIEEGSAAINARALLYAYGRVLRRQISTEGGESD